MSQVHTAPVSSYTPDAPHARLLQLVGSFQGPTRTFMEPHAPNDESVWEVEISAILGGRHVELEYTSSIMGGPHAGRLLISHHNGAFSAVWIDSFHTGTDAILFSQGAGPDEAIVLDGGYVYEGHRFGWRILVRQPDPDQVWIDHVNIMPGRGESPALETRLRRRSA